MSFSSFVEKAILQDKRNIFTKYDGNLDIVPDELKSFYKNYNPTDVEISKDGVAIRLFSAENLPSLQEEYAYLKVQFVFATYNGDPIFLHDGHVYTCPHGVKSTKWQLLSDNIQKFFSSWF